MNVVTNKIDILKGHVTYERDRLDIAVNALREIVRENRRFNSPNHMSSVARECLSELGLSWQEEQL